MKLYLSWIIILLGLLATSVVTGDQIAKNNDDGLQQEAKGILIDTELCIDSGTNRTCVKAEQCNEESRIATLRCDADETICCEDGWRRGRSLGEEEEKKEVDSAVHSGLEDLEKRDKLEKVLLTKNLFVKPYTTEGMHNEYLKSDDKALNDERNSFVVVQAIKYLSYKLPHEDEVSDAVQRYMDGDHASLDKLFASFDVPLGDAKPQREITARYGGGQVFEPGTNMTFEGNSGDFSDGDRESQTRTGRGLDYYDGDYSKGCKPMKYRTIDGTCNNLKYPDWGKSFRAYTRLLSADYSDGISMPRKAKDGSYLPSARLVSTHICVEVSQVVRHNSLMVMQWGQFIDHEMSFTPIYKARGTHGVLCCAKEIYENSNLLHPECYPIPIPEDDYFHSKHHNVYDSARCMEFVRSLAAPTNYNDKYGSKRQQLNQVTSFIDGSVVYGSTAKEAASLRTYKYGQLKSIRKNGFEYVPLEIDPFCTDPSLCYRVKTGDSRANQHPWLTILHNLFLRVHNNYAYQLYRINPHWDDEYLYQETRKIVGAILQHITYNEFLPALFGYEFLGQYGLTLKRYGYNNDYDSYINPTSLNEFATAAFRVGHSLIYGSIEFRSREYGNGKLGPLRDHYFSPHEIHQDGEYDKYLLSLMTQFPEKADVHVSKEVTNYLFKTKNVSHGLDLIALNIQRGRDHGLPGYNEYRKLCGYKKAYSFDDLYPSIDKDVIDKLRYLYKHVDDIDIYIGGIAEKHNRYSLLGPTFSCIIANQFRRVKRGDRYWYELGGQPSSFTPAQLQEIRKVTLGTIICLYSDKIQYVQKWVFKAQHQYNTPVHCRDVNVHRRINLNKWKQSSGKGYGDPYETPGSYQVPATAYDSAGYDKSEPVYVNTGSYSGPSSSYDSTYGGVVPSYDTVAYDKSDYGGYDKPPINIPYVDSLASKIDYDAGHSYSDSHAYGSGVPHGSGSAYDTPGYGKDSSYGAAPAYDKSTYESPEYSPAYKAPEYDKASYGGDSAYSSDSSYAAPTYDTVPAYGADSSYDPSYVVDKSYDMGESYDPSYGDEPLTKKLVGRSYNPSDYYAKPYGADKSSYAAASKSSYDKGYKAASDYDAAKGAYYDSKASAYDKEADYYASTKDAYKKKDYAMRKGEKDYYDKDAKYADNSYVAKRRYYEATYGSNKAYEDSVYSKGRVASKYAKSGHKQYDAEATHDKSAYDASAYDAKSKADSYDSAAESSTYDKEKDSDYAASAKSSYDSDSSYSDKTKYEKPIVYAEPVKYEYKSDDYKYPDSYDYKAPTYYKKPEYPDDYSYKKPDYYPDDYKKPDYYPDDYKKPDYYPDDYKKPDYYPDDYKKPDYYPDDYSYKKPYDYGYSKSGYPDDYSYKTPDYAYDYKKPDYYPDDYSYKMPDYPYDSYKKPDYYPDDYKKPDYYPDDYKKPDYYPDDYKKPDYYPDDYKKPDYYPDDYKKPDYYPDDYKKPDYYPDDYKKPDYYPDDYNYNQRYPDKYDYKEGYGYGKPGYPEYHPYGKGYANDYSYSKGPGYSDKYKYGDAGYTSGSSYVDKDYSTYKADSYNPKDYNYKDKYEYSKTYDKSYSKPYGKPYPEYGSNGYGDRYARSHNVSLDVGNGTIPIDDEVTNDNSTVANTEDLDENGQVREERSYRSYKPPSYGRYGYSPKSYYYKPEYYYAPPPPPSYSSSAYDSKNYYDDYYKKSADHAAARARDYGAATHYYDKEADKYGAHKDAYYADDYAMKKGEADYYDKDYYDKAKSYGAYKKYYESSYGKKKAYEDSVYSTDSYDKSHAESDYAKYDAEATDAKSAYDSSDYSSKYKVDDYDKKASSDYYSKDHDDYYAAGDKQSYASSAAAYEKEKPSYAPYSSY